MRSWVLCRVILLTTGAFFAACDAGPLVIGPESAPPSLPAGNASSSPLGHIIFSRGGPSAGLYEMNPDGTNVRKVTHRSWGTAATWSPDGSRIAFGDENISVMNADGTERMRLTNDGASSNPTWSPDGARIAFARETLGTTDIYVMQADGSGVTRLTNDRLREYTPAWSPDGSTIALVGYAQGASGPPSPVRLYLMNVNGTGLRPVGPDNVAQPSFSPDGTKLAFVGKGSLYVINADGTGLRRVVIWKRSRWGAGI